MTKKNRPEMKRTWSEKYNAWIVDGQYFDEELDDWVMVDSSKSSAMERTMQTNKQLRDEVVELLYEREELQKELFKEKRIKGAFMVFSLAITISAGILIYG